MRRLITPLVVAACLATACGPGSAVLRNAVDAARVGAGVGATADSPYLDLQALAESVNACERADGAAIPAPSFAAETAAATTYVTRTSADPDDDDAAQEIIDELPAAVGASVVAAKWDRKGIATYRCPHDGLLYGTAILSDFVAIPSSGRYVSNVFTRAEIVRHAGLRYGSAPLCEPGGNDLILDVYEPVGDTLEARPTVVLIHGGGFVNGSRTGYVGAAEAYAQRGFVAVAIDYRTCPSGISAEDFLAVATNAIDDGMEAIRYLHANAETYGIDTTRIATLGSSAGGAISLGTALLADPTPGGPLAAEPTQPAAAMETGAHLTPAIEVPGFVADPAPILMFRYEVDTNAGPSDPSYEWPYSYRTCNTVHAQGGVCDFFVLDGPGHVSGISVNGPQSHRYLPWLYEHLDLATAD
ncbi:MAG: alpha/beta hydrolase [Acidimicrobiales bacterium]